MNNIKLNSFFKKYCSEHNKIKFIKKNCNLLKINNRFKLKSKYIKSVSNIVKNIRTLNIF